MGLVIASVLFLLGIGWIFSQTFVIVPIGIIERVESLSLYFIIALGIFLIAWIVGD